jgi:dihydroorotase
MQNDDRRNSCVTLLLRNVTMHNGRVADISLSKGVVKHIGAGPVCDQTIDCAGFLVLPAAVDMHVHMRGGVQSHKEDWKTGSKSALAGGVTVVVDQPNTIPPLTTENAFRDRVRGALADSACHFAINSAVTAGTPLEQMWHAGAMAFGETFFAPSGYGEAVGESTLAQALLTIHTLGALATIHAEKIFPVPDRDLASHDRARPAKGELLAVRAVGRCNTMHCRLHFCHVSSAASLKAANGTAEVAPHHLFLSRESFDSEDACGKINPPLRTERERRKLWERWDRIDVIASDHAPHAMEEKQVVFPDAPSGVPGVETMIPLLVAEVLEKKITALSLIDKTSTNPAALLGIPRAGFDAGDRADFAIYEKMPVRITADTLHSRCGWTPFEGRAAVFPRIVIMGGTVVYQDGEFMQGSPLWIPGRGYRW